MALTLVEVSEDWPISLAEAKEHLRVTINDDDNYISSLIAVAGSMVEEETGRVLAQKTYDEFFESAMNQAGLPPRFMAIELSKMPVQSVLSIGITGADGSVGSVYDAVGSPIEGSADYQIMNLNSESNPTRIAATSSWPTLETRPDALVVRYVVGYTEPADVPAPLKHAMLMLISHFHENREPVNIGNIVTALPMTVKYLLSPYRTYLH